jgi:hypothetical protein
MADNEWVQIPEFKNYEVNKDGEVRNIQTKKVQTFGKTVFRYGKPSDPFKVAMQKIMSATFGGNVSDQRETALPARFEKMTWTEVEAYLEKTRLRNMDEYDLKDAFGRQTALQTIDGFFHEIKHSRTVGSNRNSDGQWFCSCGELLQPTSLPRPAMGIHMTELGR